MEKERWLDRRWVIGGQGGQQLEWVVSGDIDGT